jgi:hypothetical protein
MKRVLAVMVIATFLTLTVGMEQTSWAIQTIGAAEHNEVVARIATLKRGSTVEVTGSDGTVFYAVIEEIGPDSLRVMRDEGGAVTTETLAISDIRRIRPVSPRRVAHGHKTLIITAIVAGVIVGVVGACASSSSNY